MHRNPALDGLRGVAVSLVVTSHLLHFDQGWVGVDIFFVLSGYLITTILLNERHELHFWKMFYVRRVTRILPPYMLLLATATMFGLVRWRSLGIYLVFFGTNIAGLKRTSLMQAAGLDILWSLAVEEHFYLLWPGQVRRLSRRTLAAVALAVLLIEPLLRSLVTLHGADWRVTYLLTPFRLDGLAAGAIIALALTEKRCEALLQRGARFGLPLSLGVVALCFPLLIPDMHVLFCSAAGFSLITIASAALLVHLIVHPYAAPARLMSWAPLAFLGRISYGVYLYHRLVWILIQRFTIPHMRLSGWQLGLASIPITIFLSWVSFRFYETFFLAWGKRTVGLYREEMAVLSQHS